MNPDFIQLLEQKLRQPLPGREAQLKMAHTTRHLSLSAPPQSKKAGVLATFFLKNQKWHLVFIERIQNEKDRHGGQIGFPGGKFEPKDQTLKNTALREAEEEVGIARGDVKILGQLTNLYIPVSNFEVYPFVGFLNYEPAYKLQKEEVSNVLEVPLSHFKNPFIKGMTTIRIGKHLTLNQVPYFDMYGKVLWGATAMIMSELIEVLGWDN